jgi:hypothetical protein
MVAMVLDELKRDIAGALLQAASFPFLCLSGPVRWKEQLLSPEKHNLFHFGSI